MVGEPGILQHKCRSELYFFVGVDFGIKCARVRIYFRLCLSWRNTPPSLVCTCRLSQQSTDLSLIPSFRPQASGIERRGQSLPKPHQRPAPSTSEIVVYAPPITSKPAVTTPMPTVVAARTVLSSLLTAVTTLIAGIEKS